MPAVRSCRVCGCTDDRACPGGCSWVDEGLCSACAVSLEHVVSMTREARAGTPRGVSVATCSCGAFKVKLPLRQHRKLDEAVRNHWREAVALAGGVHV